MESYTGQNTPGKTYIIVVNNDGDTNILNLSYDFSWQDVSVMLQVKFDYKDIPSFTYTDQEEDTIILDSQEAFEEALKVARQNSDVLHVQMQKRTPPVIPPRKSQSSSSGSSRSAARTTPHIELARAAVADVTDWASRAVRSAFNSESLRFGEADESAEISMQSVSASTESLVDDNPDHPKEVPQMPAKTDSSRPPKDGKLRKITTKEIAGTSASGNPSSSPSKEQNSSTEISSQSPSQQQQASEETQTNLTSRDEILHKIKEEVRMAISQELSVFRSELRESVLQNPEQRMCRSTADLTLEGPRTPKQIKNEIKSLREEMKAARELKKLNQQARVTSPTDLMMTGSSPQQARKYSATLICENLTNENCVLAGQQFVKYWVLKNEGTAKWNHIVELKLLEETPEKRLEMNASLEQEPKEESVSVKENRPLHDFGPEDNCAPVPPTESNCVAVIAVSHTAPDFPCTYASAWRLSHNGKLFGPRICCSVYVNTREQFHRDDQPSMSMLSSIASSHTAEYSLESSQFPSSTHPAHGEVMETQERTPASARSPETTTTPDFKAESSVDSSQVHDTPTLRSSVATEEQQAEDSSEEDDLYQLEQPQSHDTVERDSFEEAITGFTSLDVDDEENLVDHVARQEEDTSMSEAEEVISNTSSQEKRQQELDADDSSSMMSDFEVIPLPGCFDTTKPLAEFESPVDIDEENSSSLQSNSTLIEEEHVLSMEDSELNRETSEEEKDASRNNEDDMNRRKLVEVLNERQRNESEADKKSPLVKEENSKPLEDIANPSILTQSSVAQLVAPCPIPVPQSVIDLDKPFSPQTPLSVPQSVLDMDKPCPVSEYTEGYNKPPIPLPRGVLDANKPWVKENPKKSLQAHSAANFQLPSTTIPDPNSAQAPQPRIATAPQPHSAQSPQPRIATAPQPPSAQAPQPRIATAPQPHSAQAPQPRNATAPQPRSAQPPQPRIATAPQPHSATAPQPRSATVPKSRSATAPQPRSVTAPQPCSTTIPQPRSGEIPQPLTHSSERAWDARLSLESSTSFHHRNEEIDAPHIYYPPADETEEYTLAPEPADLQVGFPSSPAYPSQQQPSTPPTTHDGLPFTPGPMEQLIDMGFCDIDMNKDLLAAFQGDLARVINALVYKGGDDNTNSLSLGGNRDDGSYVA